MSGGRVTVMRPSRCWRTRTCIGEVEERVAWFRDYGVRECWLVHQIGRTVEVLQFEGGRIKSRREHQADERIVSGVLPDFDNTVGTVLGY
jgi:hypothetical protein